MLQEASKKLGELQTRYEDATGQRTTDFLHFKSMVDQVISSDNGEAGLEPLVNNLFKKVASKDGI